MEILDILAREAEISPKVYLYEEKGHWYAYEQSAMLISRMLNGIVTIRQFIHDTYELILKKVEIMDLNQLINLPIISCSDMELVITCPDKAELYINTP